MKTIPKLGLIVILFITTSVFGGAMAQEKTIYGYCYSTPVTKYSEIKTVYVSNIVTGVIDSKEYYDSSPTSLTNQWADAVKAEADENSFKYSDNVLAFHKYSEKDEVENDRTKRIREFKQDGYTVIILHNFKFSKEKKRN